MLKKLTAFVLVTLIVFSLFINVSFASTGSPAGQKRAVEKIERYENGHTVLADYIKGEVLVKYGSGYSDKDKMRLLARFSASKVKTAAGGQYTLLRMKDTAAVKKFLQYAKSDPGIEYAAPNYAYAFPGTDYPGKNSVKRYSSKASAVTVNDPMAVNQWFHDTIHLSDAWDITMGDPSVKIAVIDSGADTNHPDLAGQFYKSRDFSASTYVDNRTKDSIGHGTHVCGIIAAKANNSTGVAGVAPGVKLMMADISPDDELLGGFFTEESVIDAIYWSADQGARVINMSLTTSAFEENPLLKTAIKYAADHNVVVVCAAGNDGLDDSIPMYPSDDENALSVISVDSDKEKSGFSNYGASKEISAPGGVNVYNNKGILSTIPTDLKEDSSINDIYDYYEGTSMAAPVVSGVFGLLFSKYPGLTAAQAEDIVYKTAQDDTRRPGKDIYLGYGVIDAKAALDEAAQRVGTMTNIAVTPASPELGVTTEATIAFDTNKDGYATVTIKKDGEAVKNLWSNEHKTAGTQSLTWDFKDSAGQTVKKIGEYQVEIGFRTATGASGYVSAPVTFTFTLDAPDMNVTGAAVSPAAPVEQAHGPFTVSANLDQKGEMKAYVYKGSTLVRTLSSGVKEAGSVTVLWDQKDNEGKYVPAGTYTVKMTGTDVYGRESAPLTAGSAEITADTTAPVLSDAGGAGAFTNNGTSLYTRNLSLSEPGAYTVKIYRGSVSPANLVRTSMLDASGTGTDTFQWNGRRDNGLYVLPGAYTFAVSAKDLIGNASNAVSYTVDVTDSTSLSIAGSLSASTVKPKVNTLTVNYNLSENAVVNLRVYNDSGTLVRTLVKSALKQKGPNSVKWDLKKSSGGYVPDGVYSIQISGDNGNGKGSGVRKLAATVSSDNGRPRVTIVPVSHTFRNYGKTPYKISFKVSEKAKSASMDIVSGGHVIRSFKLSGLSANTAYSFSWDGKDKTGAYVRSGSYSARIKAVDLAGNTSHTASKSIFVRDYTKPVITVPKVVDYDYYKGGSVSFSVKLSEAAYVTAKVYDYFGDYVFTITSGKRMKAGSNKITFTGKDNHGYRIPPYVYPLEVRFTAVDYSGNKSSGIESCFIGGDGGDEEG